MKTAIGSGFLHVVIADPARLDDAARLLENRLGGTTHRNAEGAELSIVAPGPEEANAALGALLADGIELSSFAMGSPSLEEVFLALTGGDAALGGDEGA